MNTTSIVQPGIRPTLTVISTFADATTCSAYLLFAAITKALHIPGFKKQEGVEIAAVANRSRESS